MHVNEDSDTFSWDPPDDGNVPSSGELSALLDLVVSSTFDYPAATERPMLDLAPIPILPWLPSPRVPPCSLDDAHAAPTLMIFNGPIVFSPSPTVSTHSEMITSSSSPLVSSIHPQAESDLRARQPARGQLVSALNTLQPMEILPSLEARQAQQTPKSTCSVPGCSRRRNSFGNCVRHGNGNAYSTDGHTRTAGQHKLRWSALKLCVHPGCKKRMQRNQRCFQHGGYRKCCVIGCARMVHRGGCCDQHETLDEE